jgi:sugar lactone lactonase YvrE
MSRLAFMLLCPLMMGAGRTAPADPAVNHSTIAFALEEKDWLPENLAYDPKRGAFLVGSTRYGAIRGMRPGCSEWDFETARAHGLWQVIGMKADAERRVLWVASSDGDNLVGHRHGNGNAAGLFKFDLDTGALLGRYLLDEPGVVHFLNDLVVAPDGDVYVTHMFDTGQVWRLDVKTGTFASFYNGDADFHDPNGIAITPDGKRLYVAEDRGVSMIEVASRARTRLESPAGFQLGGIDGLYLHGHSLVFIQPDLKRVARCKLDEGGLRIMGCDVLEENHPLFAHPTTGVIVDDALYYIANSQFDSVGADGSLPPLEQLYQPVILKLKL